MAVALGVAAIGLRAGFGARAQLAGMLAPVVLVAANIRPGVALLGAGALALIWASRPE